jgi:hypothetical protein
MKFNKGTVRPAVTSPVTTELTPTGATHMGAPGYARTVQSELFLLAVTYLVSEDTHHESGVARDARFVPLVRQVAVEDPEWTLWFLRYLRQDTHMRTSAVVGAAEATRARLEAGANGWSRQIIEAVLQRADEPSEFLAYWLSVFGKPIPSAVKRALSTAVWRLYSEWSVLKYDSPDRPLRFADVIALVRPTGTLADADGTYPIKGTWRAELYDHLCRRRQGGGAVIPRQLRMLRFRKELMAVPVEERRGKLMHPEVLKAAGMTREALAGWLEGEMDALAYEAIIPSMGYTALLSNLRNFDKTGVSDAVARRVGDILADPGNVAKSRVLPLRFLAAHRAVNTLRWGWSLEQALGHSLGNIPELPGHTLVMVDTSTSMKDPLSRESVLKRWDAAATFGIALAGRCQHAEVVSFSSARRYWGDPPGVKTKPFPLHRGESLLRAVDRWKDGGYFLGGGTDTALALRHHYTGGRHDRVVILTDEQVGVDPVEVSASIPVAVPLYTLNLAGYEHGHAPSGVRNRHTFGGLTDAMFTVMRLIEAGDRADWEAVFGTTRTAPAPMVGARTGV